MPMVPVIKIEKQGAIAVLCLSRSDKLNALNEQVCRDVLSAIDEIETWENVSVLVVRGEGRAFCAGADLAHMKSLPAAPLRRFIELTWAMGERVSKSPLLSIAALHGYTLGGGAELALACDLRVANDDLVFGFPEMALGSVPGSGGMQYLPELIGYSRALELVIGGRRLNAEEALKFGLVNKVADAGDFIEATSAWARTFSDRPAEAIRYAKACIRLPNRGSIAGFVHGLVSSTCQQEQDYQKNVDRFSKSSSQS